MLTRLHARYDATALGEDLVFEAAPAITGGREVWGGRGRELEKGATIVENGVNNFQARYAIRHAWAGEITCVEPVRGVWGGPPEGPSSPPVVARQLADVGRGASLGSFVTAEAGEQIGTGVAAAVSEPPPVEEAPVAKEAPAEAESAPTAPASGCACSSGSEPVGPAAPLALLALLGLRRSRARRDLKPAS